MGRAVAVEAVRSGAAATIHPIVTWQRGAEAVSELLQLGAKAAFVAADLEEQVVTPARIISAAINKFGRVDGLVNAAGLSDRGSVAGADIALFDQLFAVNTRAPMFLMQGIIRHLKERNMHGAIVNILSFQAHGASINLAIYGATKAAMSLLTKNAAYAHREDRIRINGINLGVGGHIWRKGDADRQTWKKRVLVGGGRGDDAMGPPDQPGDVARLALFLLNDVSIPMTGALIDQEQHSVLGVRSEDVARY